MNAQAVDRPEPDRGGSTSRRPAGGASLGDAPNELDALVYPTWSDAWSEPRLIELAYAYEQTTRHRRPPACCPPLAGR